MSSLEKLTKLNDICLFVDDFWGSLNYYVEKFGFRVIRGFGQHVEYQIHDERADGTADKQREHVPRPTGQIIQFAEQAPGVFHYRYPPRKNPEIVCF